MGTVRLVPRGVLRGGGKLIEFREGATVGATRAPGFGFTEPG